MMMQGKGGKRVAVSGFGVFAAAFRLVLNSFINSLFVFGTFLANLLLSPLGFILIGFILLSVATALMPSIVPRILNSILSWWNATPTQRYFWADIINLVTKPMPVLFCFWNLYWHLSSNLLNSFVSIALDCVDLEYIKTFFTLIATLLLGTAGALVNILEDPINGTVPIYFNKIWINTTLWGTFQNITEHLEVIADCECHEVQPVTSFLLDRIRSDNLGQAVDLAVNAALAFPQTLFPVLTQAQRPYFDTPIDRASAAVIALGAWVDEWLTEILFFLFPSAGQINLAIGCLAARAVCIAFEVVKLLLRFTVAVIAGDNVFTTFQTIRFEGVVKRIDDMADCLESALNQIDICLGEAISNILRYVGDIIEFATKVVQTFTFDWPLLFQGLFRIVGNQTYDVLGAGSHIVPCDGGLCTHTNPTTQTGLTCLVSKILGDRPCSRAVSDLASAILQLLTLPLLVAEEFLTTDYSSFNFGSSNPLNDATRDEFNDMVLDIVSVLTDRVLLLFDYTAHLIACIPGLNSLGVALYRLVAVLDNVVDDIKTMGLLAVELVTQTLLWILALFGISPFAGSDSGDELLTWFSLFIDALIQLFDLIINMLEGFLNYFIFSWFPSLFGQGTMLGDNPGTATFTGCFTEMDDCICGITKNIANDICLPAGIGCLGGLWPDCGDFEPSEDRRRSSTNEEDWYELQPDGRYHPRMNIYDYYATAFNDTYCGPIFQKYADNLPERGDDGKRKFGDADGEAYHKCVRMVLEAYKTAHLYNNASSDVLVNPKKTRELAHSGAKGYAALAAVSINNAFLMFSDPAELAGLPESEIVYFDLEKGLDDSGIDSAMVRNSVMHTYTALYNTTKFFRQMRTDAFRSSRDNPRGKVSPWVESVKLVDTAWRTGSHAIATASVFGHHFTRTDVATPLYEGGNELARWALGKVTPESSTAAMVRRVGEPPAWAQLNEQAMADWRLSQGLWPKEITGYDQFAFKWRKISEAASETWAHLSGKPTLMPRANMLGEVEDHIPDSCSAVLTGCPVADNLTCSFTPGGAYRCPTAPCSGDIFYIPPFRMCNDFYGSALVAGFCNSSGQNIDFYATVQQCENGQFRTARLGAFSALGTDMTCYNTGNPSLGSVCIHPDGCLPCPVDQVLPNFDCDLLDEFVHRVEYEFGLCYNLLGIGPPLPTFPYNLTTWDSFAPSPNETRTVYTGVCGNNAVERNYTYSIRNPDSGRLIQLVGEQCDPPGSTAFLTIDGESRVFTCGVYCQWERCGNSIVDPGEQCDDHNRINGDHCTDMCQLELCGNGFLDFGEQCDDGNRDNGDGCGKTCRIEKCGQANFLNQDEGVTFLPTVFCAAANTVANRPDQCFTDGTFSFEFNCHSHNPIIWTYTDTGCFSRQTTYQITEDCPIGLPLAGPDNTVCLNPFLSIQGSMCVGSIVQADASTICATDCPVCGNGIVEPGEACDDGSIYATGNATLDACVNCELTCTCDSNPLVPCRGICGTAGSLNLPCDPRVDGPSQCGVGGICTPIACCGDGDIQEPYEDCDPGPSGVFNTSNCFQCLNSECSCQPGKPCLGTCFDQNGIRMVASYDASTVLGGEEFDFVYCDVNDNPFACPLPGQTCVPWSCCGDNITQSWETEINGGCEPISSPSCPPENCSYYDTNGDLKAPRELAGSRDSCEVQPGEAALGTCGSTTGVLLPYLCDRTIPTSCEDNGAPTGSLCLARSCCGDGVTTGIERLFSAATTPCDNQQTIACLGNPLCNYEHQYFPLAECTCDPDPTVPCMGRCQVFRTNYGHSVNIKHGLPCDPRNMSNSPWCPADLNGIACIPIACCGDGTVQSYSGTPTYNRLLSPLESCDSGDCTSPCGIQQNILPDTYTRCECQFNNSCMGLCITIDTGKTNGVQCDDNTAFCGPGLTCWPQACCGDGIQQTPYETSEGVDNLCGLPFPPIGAKRRRSVETGEIPETQSVLKMHSHRLPDGRYVFHREQHHRRAVQLEEFETSQLFARPQFHEDGLNVSGWLDGVFMDITDWFFVQVFDSDLNSTLEPWIQRLSSTEIDPYTPEEERGLLYYGVNFFRCTVPLRTNGQEGIGAWAAIWLLIKIYFFVGLFLVFVFFYFSSAITPVLSVLLMYATPFLFMYIAYGYMFPKCLPMIPLTVPRDIDEIATFLRQDCPFSLTLDNGTAVCFDGGQVPDCEALGFETGTDILIYWLEKHYPEVNDYLAGSTVQNFSFFVQLLDAILLRPIIHLLGLDTALANFDFTANPTTPEQRWCYDILWPMIFQVFAKIGATLLVLIPALWVAVLFVLDFLQLFNAAAVFALVAQESMSDRVAYEVVE